MLPHRHEQKVSQYNYMECNNDKWLRISLKSPQFSPTKTRTYMITTINANGEHNRLNTGVVSVALQRYDDLVWTQHQRFG